MHEADAANKNMTKFKYFHKTHATWEFVISCSWKIP